MCPCLQLSIHKIGITLMTLSCAILKLSKHSRMGYQIFYISQIIIISEEVICNRVIPKFTALIGNLPSSMDVYVSCFVDFIQTCSSS